jgi:UPF0755 protein
MNDVRPPGRLSRPPQRPAMRLNDVRAVPVTPRQAVAPPSKEPDTSQPLDLPKAAPPERQLALRKKRRWLKWVLIALAVLLVACAAAAFVGYTWYKDSLNARSNSSESIRITVDSGETADSVATKLEQKGVIKSALALQIYMKISGKGNIKAGSYLFSPSQTPAEIVQWLDDGRLDTFKVTIVPGSTLVDIKKVLRHHYTSEAIDAAFMTQYQGPLFTSKPANTSLEGYIYPETYFVASDMTVEQLLKMTFDEFDKKINELNLGPLIQQRNLTLYQAITLASIIEKEVPSDADQRQVSQVFHARLSQGIPLGSDVTYHYGAALLGVAPSPDLNSPYNTRKVAGLPPGPIGNFSIRTLQAVASPAAGDYLFFIAGDDGVTHFAHTDQEHQANVQKYCHKLCSNF